MHGSHQNFYDYQMSGLAKKTVIIMGFPRNSYSPFPMQSRIFRNGIFDFQCNIDLIFNTILIITKLIYFSISGKKILGYRNMQEKLENTYVLEMGRLQLNIYQTEL